MPSFKHIPRGFSSDDRLKLDSEIGAWRVKKSWNSKYERKIRRQLNTGYFQNMAGALFGLFLFLVFYLSWIPDGMLKHVRWLPASIAEIADQHDKIRTGIPFVFLGILGSLMLPIKQSVWKNSGMLLFGLLGVVTVAEVGQLLLPQRVFDRDDIMWGLAGSALGVLPVLILRLIKRANRQVIVKRSWVD